MIHCYPSFYNIETATLENVLLIRNLTLTKATALLSCHLFNHLTLFIQNPIGKHYIPFNLLKTKRREAKTTM